MRFDIGAISSRIGNSKPLMDAGAAPRGVLGEDMSTPLFFRIDFLIRLNSNEKSWGRGLFFLLRDRYSFPLVFNSVISRSYLICVSYMGIRAMSNLSFLLSRL